MHPWVYLYYSWMFYKGHDICSLNLPSHLCANLHYLPLGFYNYSPGISFVLICEYLCYHNLQPPLWIFICHALPAAIWPHVPSGVLLIEDTTHILLVVSPCWTVPGGSQYYFSSECSLSFPGSLSLQTSPGTLQSDQVNEFGKHI